MVLLLLFLDMVLLISLINLPVSGNASRKLLTLGTLCLMAMLIGTAGAAQALSAVPGIPLVVDSAVAGIAILAGLRAMLGGCASGGQLRAVAGGLVLTLLVLPAIALMPESAEVQERACLKKHRRIWSALEQHLLDRNPKLEQIEEEGVAYLTRRGLMPEVPSCKAARRPYTFRLDCRTHGNETTFRLLLQCACHGHTDEIQRRVDARRG
jgi:hypothetical protein